MGKTSLKSGLLKHVTINVRGIRSPEKRRKIFHWICEKKYDIVFLQETFLTADLKEKVDQEWKGKAIYNFSDSNHSRGVAILFSSVLNVSIVNTHKSNDGRKLLVNAKLNDKMFTFVNLYSPNNLNVQKEFYQRARTWINNYALDENHIFVAGDMNTSCKSTNWKYYLQCMKSLKLIDVFDYINPGQDCKTWVNPVYSCQ